MTFEEFYDMAGVVVRLRKDLEAAERLATDRQRERDQARDELGPVALQLSAHIESLTQSNAQCAEYLRQNEQLHSELVEVRAALAATTEQRDSLRRTLDEWERADTKPHARIDEVAQTVPVCMQCLKERIKTAHAYETGPAVAILTKPLLPADVADHVVPPVLPLCMKCHGCGFVLETDSRPGALYCMNFKCDRTNTADTDSPYNGPCNSAVRHE